MAMSKAFKISENSRAPDPYSVLMEYRNRDQRLLFESGTINSLSNSETESTKKNFLKIVDAYGCLGVLQLHVGETNLQYLILITGCCSVGKIADTEVFRITQTQFVALQYQKDEERITEVRKLLNSGTFYFMWSAKNFVFSQLFDLTLCAQRQRFLPKLDNRFFWNRMLYTPFLRLGIATENWLIPIMCGSVEIRTIYVGHRQAKAMIISRLSSERAGTRFNVRGTNDDGHVANFVETEQVIYLDNSISSFIQTRGSVPLYWEQPGIQVGSHKVKISRGFEASIAAFDKHMKLLKERYNQNVIVNLLGTSVIGSKEGESILSQEFQKHHHFSEHKDKIAHIVFDYHSECRNGNTANLSKLLHKVGKYLDQFQYFCSNEGNVVLQQTGVIRTNCLDCLDRTNCVQTFLGLTTLQEQLKNLQLNTPQIMSRFSQVFQQMWINNGNEVSKIYAGTGAIQGGSKLMDGARSAARTIQNNLLDNSKQEAIDVLLLGSTLNSEIADRSRILLPSNILFAPTNVLREMCNRYQEYVESLNLRVAVATYNVNGGKHFRSVVFKNISLSDWLLDNYSETKPVDIYAIGFEEIVDLNASNIMAASSDNSKEWANELSKVLNRDCAYVLLSSHQLVGVCLYIFVRVELSAYIRDVAVDSVKTGLGGAAGNKGAVAIRFVLHATSLCFVCSHFAAGQSQVSERNADYAEITRRILFPMNRTLNSHEYVFWCGDFNYRLNLDRDTIIDLIANDQFDTLVQYDQLIKEKESGAVFKNYSEGEIRFAPTYKYDLFSDDYDTSEKSRAPAWTDRVLWKRRNFVSNGVIEQGNNVNLLHYNRAELKQSDHRPVIAIFDIEAHQIVEQARLKVIYDVILDLGPPDATIVLKSLQDDELDEMFDGGGGGITSALLEDLSQFGEIVLVRIQSNEIRITFRDGFSALKATALKNLTLLGHSFEISLLNPFWVKRTEAQIELASNNTIPLYSDNVSESKSIQCRPAPPPPPAPRSFVPNFEYDEGGSSPSSIYEEISNDFLLSFPNELVPPPPPPRPNQHKLISDKPPPVPARNIPPALPARPPTNQ